MNRYDILTLISIVLSVTALAVLIIPSIYRFVQRRKLIKVFEQVKRQQSADGILSEADKFVKPTGANENGK